jgi:hypothetical protein
MPRPLLTCPRSLGPKAARGGRHPERQLSSVSGQVLSVVIFARLSNQKENLVLPVCSSQDRRAYGASAFVVHFARDLGASEARRYHIFVRERVYPHASMAAREIGPDLPEECIFIFSQDT